MIWMDVLFHGSVVYVLPFWAAMILFPRAEWTKKLVASPWIILPPVLGYTLLFALHAPEMTAIFLKPSPAVVAKAMSAPWAGTLFWIYAGAFDLFIGRWIYFDAQERELHPLWVSPCLFVAIFFGPVGFLGYFCVRMVRGRRS